MDVNPLRDGLRIEPSPGPTTIVIFGASGDLTQRKLLPALYTLSTAQRLPPRFSVIGVARSPMDDAGFRMQFRTAVGTPENSDLAASLEQHLYYIPGELDDPAVYERL
ncbi:MAG TPA: glucose-6-phosphate dehydrogenase, partial [Plantibacter sp.]|nr:glucose-6-phosphate dehydrogenase [Plantibacter sp.]